MMKLPDEVPGESHEGLFAVCGNRATAHHAHVLVRERSHKLIDRRWLGQRIRALENEDVAGRRANEQVDGAGFPLPGVLSDQSYPGIRLGIGRDDLVS